MSINLNLSKNYLNLVQSVFENILFKKIILKITIL